MTNLRIATWNCFGAPQDAVSLARRRPLAPERLTHPRIAAELGRYDVVCVQECFVDTCVEALNDVRSACGFSELWVDPFRSGGEDIFGSGLAVLSRYPMQVVCRYFDRLENGWDRYARKGYCVAVIALPNGIKVHVLNTHLQAGGSDHDEIIRHLQLADLSSTLRGLRGPVLVCGDLNIPAGSAAHQDLMADWDTLNLIDLAHGLDLVTHDKEANDLLRKNEADARTYRLDYLWASNPWSWQLKIVDPIHLVLADPLSDLPDDEGFRLFASDHFGLGATVCYTRAQHRWRTVRIGDAGDVSWGE